MMRWIGVGILSFVLFCISVWATAAIYYCDRSLNPPRTIPAIVYALTVLAAVIFIRPRRYGALALVLLFVGVVCWFFSLKPRNDRDWLPDVARCPAITFQGQSMTVHNVRDCEYRSEDDYT